MWSFPFAPFVPSTNMQSIQPNWLSTNVTVNYRGSLDIEREVVSEVASFGKQLGWLTEVVLAGGKPKDADAAQAFDKLTGARDRIEKIKERLGASAKQNAEDAMNAYKERDPQAYARYVKELARTVDRKKGPS